MPPEVKEADRWAGEFPYGRLDCFIAVSQGEHAAMVVAVAVDVQEGPSCGAS